MIYGASDDDDWSSEDVWYKANPSLGYTIDIEKVQNAYISAKENAAEENVFRQLRLNQWVKQSTRWMQMDKWDACAFAVNEEELLGRECYGGLDLSSSTDITAFVLVFPPRNDTEKYMILPYFWIPEDNMRLRVRRIMSRMMYGQPRDVFRPQRAMSSIMDLSSSSLMSWEQNSISKRSHLTGGELCRWCRP